MIQEHLDKETLYSFKRYFSGSIIILILVYLITDRELGQKQRFNFECQITENQQVGRNLNLIEASPLRQQGYNN